MLQSLEYSPYFLKWNLACFCVLVPFFFLLAVVAVIVNANVRNQVTNPQIWVLSILNENIVQHLTSPKT